MSKTFSQKQPGRENNVLKAETLSMARMRITSRIAILLPVLAFLLFNNEKANGQSCQIDFPNDTIQIQCGDTALLEPIDGSALYNEDFDDQQLGNDWCTSQTPDFTNPCPPPVDGSPYLWMGPTATQPRTLITEPIDVSCGGQICFDLIMAEQSNSSPCEGPDLPDEGVHIQYSVDCDPNQPDCGGTWQDIYYFNPDTNGSGGNPPSPLVNWNNYCFSIPPAAQTDSTCFRFYQIDGSGSNFDHWGIDNFEITGSSCGNVVDYSYDGTNFDSISDTAVTPTGNSDYTVWGVTVDSSTMTTDTCTASVHVDVVGVPDLNVYAQDDSLSCLDTTQLFADHNTTSPLEYIWEPNYAISDTSAQNPEVWNYTDTTYTVISRVPGQPECADTGSVYVYSDCDTCFAPRPEEFQPSCNGASDGMITADVFGPAPPFDITWKDENGNVLAQNNGVSGMDTLDGLEAGFYTIEAVDTTGCFADTLFELTEPDSISLSTSLDTLICQNGDADLKATASGGNGPPYDYDWNNGMPSDSQHTVSPSSQTVYEVQAEDSLGCLSPVHQIEVDVHPPINVNTRPDDTICPGGSAELEALPATGGNGGPYSYKWFNMNGDTVGTGTNTTVSPNTTMSYVVLATDDCETPAGKDTMTIHIHPGYPGASVNMNVSDDEGCYPHTVDFTSLVPGNEVESTFWSFGDGSTSNDSGTTQHTYMEPGCYDVTLEVTSKNGCVEDSTFEDAVCVRDYPTANFKFDPDRGTVLDPELWLLDRSTGAETYEWRFEHVDSTSSLSELQMEFPNEDSGSYEVTQWVVNEYGCADSITKLAIIEGVHQLYVPNAFTPDGDGQNDVFRPQGEGISQDKYLLRIYNRWGELLFETDDPHEGWDGTKGGEELPHGVYVWELQVKDAYTGEERERQGHVTLLR